MKASVLNNSKIWTCYSYIRRLNYMFAMKTLYLLFALLFLIIGCGKQPLYQKDSISEAYKTKARDHFTAGMFYQLESQYDKALIEFYEALLYDSSSYAIYNRIAENHMALGRYESALRYLNRSLAINANEAETYRLMADSYNRLKKDDATIETLKKVLTLDPYDDNSRTLLILLYRKNNNQLGLAQQYEEMIRLFGFDEEWVVEASQLYLENGQLDDALKLFEAYLKHDSTSTRIWLSVGIAYEVKRESEKAIDAYYQAIKLSPDAEHIAEKIYNLCRRNNNWEKLIALFTPFLELDASIYRLAIADAYIQEDKSEIARETLQPLLSKDPVPWKTYELLGRIEMDEGNLERAAWYFRRIIEIDAGNPMGWIFLGFALTDLDSLESAEHNYRTALNYLPDNPFILAFHGLSLNRLERDEEALIPFEKALEIDSTNIQALVSYAVTPNRLSKNQAAIKAFEKTLTVDSTNITALTSLGMLYEQYQMYEQSDSLYTAALKMYPNNDLLMNNYGYSLSERNIQLDYALELAQKAVTAQPDNGAYLDTIGWIYYKLGKYDQALEYIKKSLENREESPVVVEHLGDVYLKLGYPDEAKIYWRRALQMDEDNEGLKQKIESN